MYVCLSFSKYTPFTSKNIGPNIVAAAIEMLLIVEFPQLVNVLKCISMRIGQEEGGEEAQHSIETTFDVIHRGETHIQ